MSSANRSSTGELPTWGFAYDCRTANLSECTIDTFAFQIHRADCPFSAEPLYVTCD